MIVAVRLPNAVLIVNVHQALATVVAVKKKSMITTDKLVPDMSMLQW